jgi:hypothetical protein
MRPCNNSIGSMLTLPGEWCCCCHRRGKRQQKHYTVFVADVDPTVAAGFEPKLNSESREWRWAEWTDVLAAAAGSNAGLELHPMVAVLASKHANEMCSATQTCSVPSAEDGN